MSDTKPLAFVKFEDKNENITIFNSPDDLAAKVNKLSTGCYEIKFDNTKTRMSDKKNAKSVQEIMFETNPRRALQSLTWFSEWLKKQSPADLEFFKQLHTTQKANLEVTEGNNSEKPKS